MNQILHFRRKDFTHFSCGASKSILYLIMAASGILCMVLFGNTQNNGSGYEFGYEFVYEALVIRNWGLLISLSCLSIQDFRIRRISNRWITVAVLLWVTAEFWRTKGSVDTGMILRRVLTGCFYGIGLWLFSFITGKMLHKKTLGGGDIKLAAAASLYLGAWKTVQMIGIACVIGTAFVVGRWIFSTVRKDQGGRVYGNSFEKIRLPVSDRISPDEGGKEGTSVSETDEILAKVGTEHLSEEVFEQSVRGSKQQHCRNRCGWSDQQEQKTRCGWSDRIEQAFPFGPAISIAVFLMMLL